MGNSVTITGKTGAGEAVTSLVIQNVVNLDFDLTAFVLHVKTSDSPTIKEFDLYNTTTVTYSISGRVATVAVSQ